MQYPGLAEGWRCKRRATALGITRERDSLPPPFLPCSSLTPLLQSSSCQRNFHPFQRDNVSNCDSMLPPSTNNRAVRRREARVEETPTKTIDLLLPQALRKTVSHGAIAKNTGRRMRWTGKKTAASKCYFWKLGDCWCLQSLPSSKVKQKKTGGVLASHPSIDPDHRAETAEAGSKRERPSSVG